MQQISDYYERAKYDRKLNVYMNRCICNYMIVALLLRPMHQTNIQFNCIYYTTSIIKLLIVCLQHIMVSISKHVDSSTEYAFTQYPD